MSEPGYRRQPKVYRLVFDDHPGLVVRTRSASAEMVFEVSKLQDQAATVEVVREMFERFAAVLVGWNLETEGGDPVPATVDGLLGEDFDFVMMIINAWIQAVTGVPAPLEQPSSSGSPALVESLPMEPLSGSRAS